MIPVHKSTDFPPVDLRQGFLSDDLRLLDRYELQGELIETLEKTLSHRHLVPKVARCHRSYRHWRCENNHDWAEPENSCSQRVCPHCSRRRSLILAGRMQNFLVEKTGLRYAVLSEQNCVNLADGISSLWAAWMRIRRSVRWLRKVKGCIVALEVTRNREAGTWHPHLNVLIEGEYFPHEELRQLWIRATRGRGSIVHVQAADAGTVRELIKYVTKISDLIGDPAALDEFLAAVTGMRIVRTYGSFYGLAIDDEENPGVCCPDCLKQGLTHVSIVQLGYIPAHQVNLDFDGVLRVNRSPSATAARISAAVEFFRYSGDARALLPALRIHSNFAIARFDAALKRALATQRLATAVQSRMF